MQRIKSFNDTLNFGEHILSFLLIYYHFSCKFLEYVHLFNSKIQNISFHVVKIKKTID